MSVLICPDSHALRARLLILRRFGPVFLVNVYYYFKVQCVLRKADTGLQLGDPSDELKAYSLPIFLCFKQSGSRGAWVLLFYNGQFAYQFKTARLQTVATCSSKTILVTGIQFSQAILITVTYKTL